MIHHPAVRITMSDGVEQDRLSAEQRARVLIDGQLRSAGWAVQDRKTTDLFAGQGVAVREVIMAKGHGHRSERVETERFKSFAYEELMARDKANLDITWLRDESLEDLDNLPAPEIIAREIVEDLTAALAEFEAVAAALEAAGAPTNEP